MRKETVNYTWVGLFVVAMIVILLLALYRITGRTAGTDPYYVVYDNITGVRIGTVVTYGGYQVGQVSDIVPQRDKEEGTLYRLEMSIKEGWEIPDDSVARIITTGLLSDNQIDIIEGRSDTLVQPGGYIEGEEETSIMALMNDLAYEVKGLSNDSIKPLLKTIEAQLEALGVELTNSVPKITGSASELMDQLKNDMPQVTSNATELLKKLQHSADALKNIFKDKNQKHIDNILANADVATSRMAVLSRDLKSVSAELEKAMRASSNIITSNEADVRESITDLRASLDTIARSVDSIVYNLESASQNMNEFSRQIRQNPSVLLGGKPPPDRGLLGQ